ncbi:hypothetical protein ACF0H5_024571 [Mactra antiquata]
MIANTMISDSLKDSSSRKELLKKGKLLAATGKRRDVGDRVDNTAQPFETGTPSTAPTAATIKRNGTYHNIGTKAAEIFVGVTSGTASHTPQSPTRSRK